MKFNYPPSAGTLLIQEGQRSQMQTSLIGHTKKDCCQIYDNHRCGNSIVVLTLGKVVPFTCPLARGNFTHPTLMNVPSLL